MEQLVRIRQTAADGTATVLRVRESACSGDCHKCSGCGAAKEAIVFTAENPIGAQAGDLVRVRTETAPLLKAATVLYMLPLVLFFGGYALGAALGFSGALMGGVAFGLSIVFIVVYDRRMAKKDTTRYTIIGYAQGNPPYSVKKGDNDLG